MHNTPSFEATQLIIYITFKCEFFNLNQYDTGYLNAFEPQKKKKKIL